MKGLQRERSRRTHLPAEKEQVDGQGLEECCDEAAVDVSTRGLPTAVSQVSFAIWCLESSKDLALVPCKAAGTPR